MMKKYRPENKTTLLQMLHIIVLFFVVISLGAQSRSSYAQDITSNLIGHWTMDETGTTTTLNDYSSINANGTMESGLDGTSTVPGIIGTAIDFGGPGTNEVITIPNDANHNVDIFTMAFWIKTTDSCGSISHFNCNGILRKINGSPPGNTAGWYLVPGRNSGGVTFVWGDGSTTGSLTSPDINDDTWHHIAVVKRAAALEIYIDGLLRVQEPFSGGSMISTADFVIGNGVSSGTNRSFEGALDDIRYYGRDLSAADVETLYMVSGQSQASPGYFVLIGNQPTNSEANEFDGNLGGLAGANATCLSYLTDNDWLGKSVAENNNMLTAGNVKAWLCDDTECQNLKANTPYNFAKTEAGETNLGGASFTTDQNGYYPVSNVNDWDENLYFANDTNYWTGRNADFTPSTGNTCNNWTSNAGGVSGNNGDTEFTDSQRWTEGPQTCDTTDQFVCFVNPTAVHSVCNAGHAGKIIYNIDYHVMQYCDGTNWINMGKDASVLHGLKTSGADYAINAVEFDGTNELLKSPITGMIDSQKFTASFWVRPPTEAADFMTIIDNTNARFHISLDNGANNTNGLWTLYIDTNSPNVFEYESAEIIPENQWSHVLISGDSSSSTLTVYVNDALDTPIFTNTIASNIIDFTRANYVLGSFVAGGDPFNGAIADLWLETNSHIDLSVEANRRKFISAAGRAVNLGTDGSIPTGSAPDIFLSGDTATWHTNKGTGGGFTENGALTDATTLPPAQYQKKLVGWWKLNETSGTTAADSSDAGETLSFSGETDLGAITEDGPIGTAFSFDGVDDFFSYTASPSMADIFKNGGTISFWIKPRDTTNQTIWLNKGEWTLRSEAGTAGQTGIQFAQDFTGSTAIWESSSTTPAITGNEWHHVVLIYDASSIINDPVFYIDGTLLAPALNETSSPIGSFVSDATRDFSLGASLLGTNATDAGFDDIRFYNYALSAAEVTELYSGGSSFASYIPGAVNFAGTGTQRIRSGFVGPADGTAFTGSFWIRRTVDAGSIEYIMGSNGTNTIYIDGAGDIFFYFRDGAATTDLLRLTAATDLTDQNWHHVMYSFDLTNTSNRYVYVDDLPVALTLNAYVNGAMDFNPTNFALLGTKNGTNGVTADITDFWFDYGTFIDLSIESNRRKFISDINFPVDLGTDGSTPTGSQPDVYLSNSAASIATNLGSGGGFTLVNGTFTDVDGPVSNPKIPPYCSSPSQPEGTLIYNTDEDVMQYCDGNRWIPLGPQGSGGGGCSNPSGVAGSLVFNADFNTLQYCEGNEWIGIGRDPVSNILVTELEGHWKLDETSGTTAVDSSGNGNNGTLTTMNPATDWVSGQIYGALDFNGATSRVTIGDPASGNLDFANRSFSFGAWVYPTGNNGTYDMPIYKGGSSAGTAGYDIELGSSNWTAHIGDGVDNPKVIFSASPILNEWSHLFVVINRTTQQMNAYLNGILVDNIDISSIGSVSTASSLNIGANNSGNNPFLGRIDDVRIYSRALSSNEILALYNLADCPTSGDTCNNGSVYVDERDYGSGPERVYATATDSSNGIRWKDAGLADGDHISTDSSDDGRVNAANLNFALTNFPAIELCENLTLHGKSDWYLPSRNELNLLKARSIVGLETHWSSTEEDATNARVHSGSSFTTDKDSSGPDVRCIRRD